MTKVWLILLICCGLLLTGCEPDCSLIQRLNIIGWSSEHNRIFLHYQNSDGFSEKDFIYEYHLKDRSVKLLNDLSEKFPDRRFFRHSFIQEKDEFLFSMSTKGSVPPKSPQEPPLPEIQTFFTHLNEPYVLIKEPLLEDYLKFSRNMDMTPDQHFVLSKAGVYFNRKTKEIKKFSIQSETYSFETIVGDYKFFNDKTLILVHRSSDSEQLITAEFDPQEGILKNFNTIATKDSTTDLGFLGKQDAETLLYYRQTVTDNKVEIGSYNILSKKKSEKTVTFDRRLELQNANFISSSAYSSKHRKIAIAMGDFLYLADIETGKVEQLLDAYWNFPKQKNYICKLGLL